MLGLWPATQPSFEGAINCANWRERSRSDSRTWENDADAKTGAAPRPAMSRAFCASSCDNVKSCSANTPATANFQPNCTRFRRAWRTAAHCVSVRFFSVGDKTGADSRNRFSIGESDEESRSERNSGSITILLRAPGSQSLDAVTITAHRGVW